MKTIVCALVALSAVVSMTASANATWPSKGKDRFPVVVQP